MSGRTAAILGAVFGWWVLVILPGAMTLAGAFGDLNIDSTISGSVSGTWILFYCAQLAMVYVIGHALGHTRAWWFFVASLLPWLVDWATLAGVGWGLVSIAAAGLFAVLVALLSLRTEALDTKGVKVDATVVKVLRNYMNIVINNAYIRRRVQLAYTLPDGTKEQRVLGMVCEIGTSPSAGDHIQLRVDPRHPHHIAVDPAEFSE